MSYIVKAHHWQSREKVIFEGPLDLLLDLIEKEKLDITEVSLARVTDQFLEYLEKTKDINPENLADFLLIAGKLILIKSKAILPMLELEKEEEEDIEELKERLKEYKRFKEVCKKLKILRNNRKMFFSRESYSGMRAVFCPPQNITAVDLLKSFEKALNKLPQIENLAKEVVKNVISIKEKIEHLRQNLAERIEMTFGEVIVGIDNRVEIIVTFLAMLELMRKNIIIVEQSEMFGEIKIKKLKN